MVRAGLGRGWKCLFANDIDAKKAASYSTNWGSDELHVGDVSAFNATDLPGHADLVWASFPCQDLSLAGNRAGLNGTRSGTFWPFMQLTKSLVTECRTPRLIVLENVCGVLTSSSGRDFAAIGTAIANAGYRFGAIIINASNFVPQSRPRIFIIAIWNDLRVPERFTARHASTLWHPTNLRVAHDVLPETIKPFWIWWRLPRPSPRKKRLIDLLEFGSGIVWNTTGGTQRLLSMMSGLNLRKIHQARRSGRLSVGAIYKRTRFDSQGSRVQRAEVRFDGVAGCLRTPAGGSSRQVIIAVHGPKIRSRLLMLREAARLMGLPASYELPSHINEAHRLLGDGVAVPVVRFLARALLEPILDFNGDRWR